MTPQAPISIYEYDDFRLYLKHRFEARQSEDPKFSHRVFAARAGFSNPGFLNDVIKGRRRLSTDATAKMAKGFSLSAVETDYFSLLVAYGQAKGAQQKQELYRQITSRRNRSAFARLNPALSRYYQDLRYLLIRNAIQASDFCGDYEALARFVQPPLPSAEVKKLVRDLCEWGLVRQNTDGRYVVTDAFIEPPSTLKEQLRQLNRASISDAIDALMSLPAQKRHMSSRLLSVSPEVARKISEKVELFRDEVWEMVKNDPKEPSCVMQLNIQYFPRSKSKEQS